MGYPLNITNRFFQESVYVLCSILAATLTRKYMFSALAVYVVRRDVAICQMLRRWLGPESLTNEYYRSAREFIAVCRPNSCECLVVAPHLAGMTGLDLKHVLAAKAVRMRINFLCGQRDVSMAARAIKAGAFDFQEKPPDKKKLLMLVHEAPAKDARARIKEGEEAAVTVRIGCLTAREEEVMGCIVAGESSKQIAMRLATSPRTVETHRLRLMQKMEVRSLAQLITMASSSGASCGTAGSPCKASALDETPTTNYGLKPRAVGKLEDYTLPRGSLKSRSQWHGMQTRTLSLRKSSTLSKLEAIAFTGSRSSRSDVTGTMSYATS